MPSGPSAPAGSGLGSGLQHDIHGTTARRQSLRRPTSRRRRRGAAGRPPCARRAAAPARRPAAAGARRRSGRAGRCSCLVQRTKSPAAARPSAQHRRPAVPGPAVGRPGEARGRARADVDSRWSRSRVLELAPEPHHLGQRLAARARRAAAAARRRRPGATRRPARTRTRPARPASRPSQTPGAQALGGQQVQLGVERGQPPARGGDRRRRRGSRAARSTPQTRSKVRAMVWVRLSTRRRSAVGLALAAGSSARPSGRGPPARRSRGRGAPAARARSRGELVVVGRRRPRAPARLAAVAVGRARWRAAWRPGRGALPGCAALKYFGMRSRSQRLDRRPGSRPATAGATCRSAVSTSGRGPVGPPGRARVEHDGQPGPAAGRHPDDVAEPQPLQRAPRPARRGWPRRCATASASRSDERAAQRGVLLEVAEVAGHRLAVALQRLLVAAHLPGQPDHRPVGLELGERRLQQLRARSRPTCPTRLTAMLYDGRKLDRSG